MNVADPYRVRGRPLVALVLTMVTSACSDFRQEQRGIPTYYPQTGEYHEYLEASQERTPAAPLMARAVQIALATCGAHRQVVVHLEHCRDGAQHRDIIKDSLMDLTRMRATAEILFACADLPPGEDEPYHIVPVACDPANE